MFFERHDGHMFDPHMGFLNDGAYEMCAGSTLKEDQWQKVQNLLPTPPCSPEDLCYQGFPELIPPPPTSGFQQNLQVVPDEIPDDLVETGVEPLPVLELSDEEMQKLTSPTVYDDTIWQQARPSLPPTQPSSIQRDHFETNSINVSDVNYISHGIRTVHISDSVIRAPGFSQSFVLTVNANPIQPLNSMAHLTTREILMSRNATTWSLNSDPNFMNERATRVGSFDATSQAVLPDSPSKKGRKIRRLSRNTQESGLTEENAEDSEDSETTRATHNVLERKRREELKEKFQRLRDCLPELQDNDRAPKVLILKKSCEYVKFLEQEEQRLLADKELERQRFLILLNKQRSLLRQGIVSMGVV